MPDPSLPLVDKAAIEDIGDARIVRHWHKNGRLIAEFSFKRKGVEDFIYHGESKQWSSDGQYIGSSTMRDGSGVLRQWFDNGRLFGEISMVDGQFTGLQCCWDESGYLMVDQFWYRGKMVSKKRYRDLQATDATVPHYPAEAFATIAQKRKRDANVT